MNDFNPVYFVTDPDSSTSESPIRRPSLAILVGHGDRAWMEARRPENGPRFPGTIKILVPEKPDFDAALLDALIAFWPERFRSCPSFAAVESKLGLVNRLDFEGDPERIPEEWAALRREARPIYDRLVIVRVEGGLIAPRSLTPAAPPKE